MSAFEDRFRDLCAGWALGALAGNEFDEFREMLESAGPEMIRECRALEEAALHLPLASECVEPPGEVRVHILAAVRAERDEHPRDWAFGLVRRLHLDRPRVVLAVTAALLALVASLGWYTARLDRAVDWERQRVVDLSDSLAERERLLGVLESKSVEIVALDGLEVHPQGHGKIIWDAENRVALLQVSNLPPLPPDEVYQLWVFPKEGTPTSAGIFAVGQLAHNAFFRLDRFPAGARQVLRGFLVTREPEGGAAEPSGRWYLGAQISS